jgi:hypothetical protein
LIERIGKEAALPLIVEAMDSASRRRAAGDDGI